MPRPCSTLERRIAGALAGDGAAAAARWAASGAMALTGPPDGRPSVAPARLALAMDALAESIAASSDGRVVVDGPALLGERAAHAGLARRGSTSCGGQCRLLRAADGWIAVSLARPDDVASLDAWLETTGLGSANAGPDASVAGRGAPAAVGDELAVDWAVLADVLAGRPVADLVERAGWLGMAVGAVGEIAAQRQPAGAGEVVGGATDEPLVLVEEPHAIPRRAAAELTVVDLSSLWAGPLCANLLGLAGARVIKVESTRRPDGARFGPAGFFDLLHGGHESVALDLSSDDGRRWLRRLLDGADVVIEASRPRALEAMGASFAHRRAAGWTGVWLSITGHPDPARVGFGDDAAAAGGLVVHGPDGPMFCADAVADPLTGTLAAAVALEALRSAIGGRHRLSLAATAAFVADAIARHGAASESPQRPSPAQLATASAGAPDPSSFGPGDERGARPEGRRWPGSVVEPDAWSASDPEVHASRRSVESPSWTLDVAAPRSRAVTALAPVLGADTDAVLGAL